MPNFVTTEQEFYPSHFLVAIDLSGYPTADAETNGGLFTRDHQSFSTLPSTEATAKRVARGHLRFLSVVEEISKYADSQIIDVSYTSADINDADNQPTTIQFVVKIDRNEGILEELKGKLDSAGVAISTIESAIKQLVVNGITRGSNTGYSKRVRVYQPAYSEEVDQVITIKQPVLPAVAITDVTVTKLVS